MKTPTEATEGVQELPKALREFSFSPKAKRQKPRANDKQRGCYSVLSRYGVNELSEMFLTVRSKRGY